MTWRVVVVALVCACGDSRAGFAPPIGLPDAAIEGPVDATIDDAVDAPVDAGSGADAGEPWPSPFVHRAYIKASNTDPSDRFGDSVALSRDGGLLVVGTSSESSAARGIDGNQADNTHRAAGAAYVLERMQ